MNPETLIAQIRVPPGVEQVAGVIQRNDALLAELEPLAAALQPILIEAPESNLDPEALHEILSRKVRTLQPLYSLTCGLPWWPCSTCCFGKMNPQPFGYTLIEPSPVVTQIHGNLSPTYTPLLCIVYLESKFDQYPNRYYLEQWYSPKESLACANFTVTSSPAKP